MRLIDADALKKKAVMCPTVGNAETLLLDIVDVENAPTIEERKTGKWILLDECANSGYYCSNCQKKLVKEGWSNTVKKIKFCPNCGAKMEGSEEE